MPIEVELPDGTIAEFPDDTSRDVIKATLRRQFKIDQPTSTPSENVAKPKEEAPKPTKKQSAADAAYEPMFASPTYIDNPMSDKADGSGMGRRVELGGRAGLQGLGSLVGLGAGGAALSPVGLAYSLFKGENPLSNALNAFGINPGRTAADAMELAKPETEGEKLASAGIEGAASLLPTMGAGLALKGAGLAPRLATALIDRPLLQAASGLTGGLAQETARQNGAGFGGQVTAGLAGGAAPMVAANAPRSLLNAITRSIINPDKARAFAQAGVSAPSLGAVSDSGLVQSIEGGLGQSVTGAGVMRKAQQEGQKIFNDVVNNAASKLANGQDVPDSLEAIGRAAREAANKSRQEFSNKATQFEDSFYSSREQLPAKLDNVMEFIDEQAARVNEGSASAAETRQKLLNQLGPMVEDVQGRLTINGLPITEVELQAQPYLRRYVTEEPGKLNIASVRKHRGIIDDKIKKPNTASPGDPSNWEMKQLSAALKKDIEAALSPEDYAKIQDYNKWYSEGSGLRNSVDDVFFGKKMDDTAIAQAILKADAKQLEQLRAVIGDEAFNRLRGGALQEVTRGRYGPSSDVAARMFSEGKTAIQPEARQVLFDGADKNIGDVAKALQESRTFTNTSNTANANNLTSLARLLLGGTAGYAFGGIPAALGVIAGPYATARAMTSRRLIDSAIRRALNPKAVHWGNMAGNMTSPWLRAIVNQLYASPNGAK